MIQLLKNIFSGHNEFASGGLLLMLFGGVGVYLRAIPGQVWDWCADQITMSITVKDEDAGFVWVKEWFLEQEFLKRVRRLDLDTTIRADRVALVPAPGRHWFWHAGRPFVVWFYRSEEKKSGSYRRSEQFLFRTIGRRQSFLRSFIEEIVTCHRKRVVARSCLFIREENYWSEVENYVPRLLESVILREGEKEALVGDIENFKQSRRRYRRLGVPYHRGYLLYGPPGTGKTSLVSAVASKFAMSIYAISLADFNDKSLMQAMHEVPQNSVILFEDIDGVISARARAERGTKEKAGRESDRADEAARMGVTLSGLLNVLDGFYAPENMLFFMTTNHPEALDNALLRPGRIDYRLLLGKATHEQKVGLYLRFFPEAGSQEASEFVTAHAAAETMAEYQGLLLARMSGRAGAEMDLALEEVRMADEPELSKK